MIHGYRRAGDVDPEPIVIKGIETVDASSVKSDFLGHSYFADTSTLLSDLYYMIKDGKRAHERFGLVNVQLGSLTYWRFKERSD